MFKLVTSDTYGSESLLYVSAQAGTAYKAGMPLKLANGVAAVASGDAEVKYICEQNVTLSENDDCMVLVHRVLPQYVYETVFTEDASGLSEGSMVTVAEGGAGVSATEGGKAEIVKIIDSAVGGRVRVRLA